MFSVGKVWKCSRVGAVRKYHVCYAHCVLPEAPPLYYYDIIIHNITMKKKKKKDVCWESARMRNII